MAIKGLSKFHYAIMTTEDTATTAPVYSTPKRLVGINKLTVEPQTETANLYGDNQALATITNTREIKISIEFARLPLEDQAALLGYTYDSTTKKMSVGDATAPNVAIMYEMDTDENKIWYYVYYKGKFAPTSEDANTRGDSLEFGLHKLDGTFVSRIDNGRKFDVIETDATDTSIATSFYASVGGSNI